MMKELKQSCIDRFAPVVAAIQELLADESKQQIFVAIDGRCASGKTTLGYYLKNALDANLFCLDDFFLQPQQRTPERLAEVGGNVDYERFKEEVLEPALSGQAVSYRRFDCSSKTIGEAEVIEQKRLNIMEGSYSQHPFFGERYDLKVFVDIGKAAQLANIKERDGEEKLKMFVSTWIPKEEAYFEYFEIEKKSDIIVPYKGGF